jgi:hypothetical protein
MATAQKPGFMYALFGLLLTANVAFTEKNYFKIPVENVEIGRVIQQNTPDTALVIVTYRDFDCRNPKILYRARRRGWSVEEAALRPEVIERLHKEQGAQYWAFIGPGLPEQQMQAYLATLPPPQVVDLVSVPDKVYIFNLGQ